MKLLIGYRLPRTVLNLNKLYNNFKFKMSDTLSSIGTVFIFEISCWSKSNISKSKPKPKPKPKPPPVYLVVLLATSKFCSKRLNLTFFKIYKFNKNRKLMSDLALLFYS